MSVNRYGVKIVGIDYSMTCPALTVRVGGGFVTTSTGLGLGGFGAGAGAGGDTGAGAGVGATAGTLLVEKGLLTVNSHPKCAVP